MATRAKTKLTVEQYLKKYEGAEGRYELVEGEVIKMAAETARHVRIKGRVFRALANAVDKKSVDCEVFQDGMSVKISANTAREPDVAVQCGKAIDDGAMLLDKPLIVVEVVSPTSAERDEGRKLAEYFTVSSIMHYLIVWPEKAMCYHHKRIANNKVLTTIIRSGKIEFDPPGITVSVKDILGEIER